MLTYRISHLLTIFILGTRVTDNFYWTFHDYDSNIVTFDTNAFNH